MTKFDANIWVRETAVQSHITSTERNKLANGRQSVILSTAHRKKRNYRIANYSEQGV
jgi:hypothetical protein